MQIKRYDYRPDSAGFVEDADGSMVYHSDVLGLIAEIQRLRYAYDGVASDVWDQVKSWQNRCGELETRLSSATQENQRLIDLLDMVYTQYDGGTDCYEYSGGMQGAHIGTAITISPEDEDKIVAILNRERPKQPAPAAHDDSDWLRDADEEFQMFEDRDKG